MKDTGLIKDKILIPNAGADLTAFACIACDQFTSEEEYWKELKKFVGDKKSALNLVLPEIYLEDEPDKRIAKINSDIKAYLESGFFRELKEGFVLTVRETPYVKRRIGLVAAIDLEKYEYAKKSSALIRATEGTIEERIPPRLKIRKDAYMEFPHVMVLFDDEKREITESLYNERDKYEKLYDFELNMGGGRLTGYFIPQADEIIKKFARLLDADRLVAKYGKEDNFLFAVGDGNHSLATAKTHWNNIKSALNEEDKKNHPARYALCELVNVYDEGIYFEPIFRFVRGVNVANFIEGLSKVKGGKIRIYDGKITARDNGADLPTGIFNVDEYIREYLSANGGTVDYIHGEENLFKLVNENKNSVGILFEKLDKKDLFKYVSKNGAFPRKTFSMGEGVEKRYYLEGRRITK